MSKTEVQAIRNKIEERVRARDHESALVSIKLYIKLSKNSENSLKEACSWLIRLGEYSYGFRIALKMEHQKNRFLCWCAFFLNAMGANLLALDLIEKTKPSTAEEYYLTAHVYLANYRFHAAIEWIKKMLQENIFNHLNAYTQKLTYLTLADAYSCVGESTRAIQILKLIQPNADERLLKGICLQAEGEYLCHLQEFKKAQKVLALALPYYSEHDRSPDYAFILKWLGYTKFKNGHKEEGIQLLSEAKKRLSKPELRDEMRLEVFRLESELGLLTQENILQLQHFPGLPEGFLSRLKTKHEPKNFYFLFHEPSKPIFKISLPRDEYALKDKTFPSIGKNQALIAFILLTHEFGLHLERAKGLLWPSEGLSHLTLDKRIESLIQAIQKSYSIKIKVSERRLFIEESPYRFEIESYPGAKTGSLPPQFLANHNFFNFKTLHKNYSASERKLRTLISHWKQQGWIESRRKNGEPIYQVRDLKD